MNAGELLEAIDAQDETLSIGLPFEDRVRLAVDDVYSSFTDSTVAGLIRRAGCVTRTLTRAASTCSTSATLNRQLLALLGTCPSWAGSRTSSSKGSPGRGSRLWVARCPGRIGRRGWARASRGGAAGSRGRCR